jgi:hypothetical protein
VWQEFFSDALQWWDHRSKKVTEHQSCQRSHVNEAIALAVVNLLALSWFLSCHGLKFGRNSFQILCTGSIVEVRWGIKINAICCDKILSLMEMVSGLSLFLS